MITDVGMKAVGMGLAVVSLAGVGSGIGAIFASLLSGIARNPSMEKTLVQRAFIGFALVEAVALYALVMAFLIMLVLK
jgi:F0F1-type ATP synthase membrane subunit c/vacuolar-type H+-ATPase subunit K